MMMRANGAQPTSSQVPMRIVTAFSAGSVAYGVKDAGFGTFLLIYYNQVLGLNPGTVGLVVMFALILDAFIDPVIGTLSDRTRNKWGRRHPWMYASVLPIAVGWLLLWNPPTMAEPAMLIWLFAATVLVRSAMSCFEIASQALTPELTQDYDERTRIIAYRYLFGWIGGLVILLLGYAVFLQPSSQYPDGLTNADGYKMLAYVSAGLMTVAILVSSLGTHRYINRLPSAAVNSSRSFKAALKELWDTVHNRAFLILILAGTCAYSVQGIGYALATYFYNYVWQFDSMALALLPLTLLIGVVAAFIIAPRVGRLTSKPRAAYGFVIAAMLVHTSPYLLRFAGFMPEPGSPLLVPILLAILTVGTALSMSWSILASSMMADVVEESQIHTGRRNEGVFFSGSFFIQKCTSGIGIGVAGLFLFLADFPKDAKQGMVSELALDHLTLMFMLTYFALAGSAAVLFSRFPFGRAEHEARVETIAAAKRMRPKHEPSGLAE